ncbi:MAG: hypothetical protein EAZ97_11370 [Bacteroidetes bacterium]|nr:MAG: hypothetical protein EAZ97_11370 [Bacteroidota bacterium]
MKTNVFLAIFLLFSLPIFAQIEIGLGIGTTNYKGDLSSEYHILNSQPAVQLLFKYNLTYEITLRSELLLAQISADDQNSSDPFQKQRNFKFSANMVEFSAGFEYNFFNFRKHTRHFEKWSPYLFAELGIFYANSSNNQSDLLSNSLQMAIPYGVGVKRYLSRNWNLNFEFGNRQTFTDKLEGIPYNNSQASKFQKTNEENSDQYYYFGISLTYLFNHVKCPDLYIW